MPPLLPLLPPPLLLTLRTLTFRHDRNPNTGLAAKVNNHVAWWLAGWLAEKGRKESLLGGQRVDFGRRPLVMLAELTARARAMTSFDIFADSSLAASSLACAFNMIQLV